MAESRATIVERFTQEGCGGSADCWRWRRARGSAPKCEESRRDRFDHHLQFHGRFRMAGRGSMAGMMPYGNANALVREMAHEVLTAVSHTPVLAGVCATDPFMIRDRFLRELKDMGFAGIQNFPTVGLIDGVFRANLEETGMGFSHEIDCIAAAHQLDLLTTPYAFDRDQARLLTEAGADIVVAHMGLTTTGTIGAKTAKTLGDCVRQVTEIAETAKAVRENVLVLCHGGPIAMPDDAQFILDRVPAVDGFYGASSMERLPTERAIAPTSPRLHEWPRAAAEKTLMSLAIPHAAAGDPSVGWVQPTGERLLDRWVSPTLLFLSPTIELTLSTDEGRLLPQSGG